ncbi:MAG: hypothetical protein AAF578_08415 [Pseudomonadota bacterium]
MSNRFVELALPVDDLLAARTELTHLGFTECPVTDAWSHGYTALRLGTITVGLHEALIESPTIVVTRSALAESVRSDADTTDWQRLQLDEDEFNYALRTAPEGQPLLIVEASTHASLEPMPIGELEWVEYQRPTSDFTRSVGFWAPYAETTSALSESPMLRLRMDIGGLPMGLQDSKGEPAIVLCVTQVEALIARLAQYSLALLPAEHPNEVGRLRLGNGTLVVLATQQPLEAMS